MERCIGMLNINTTAIATINDLHYTLHAMNWNLYGQHDIWNSIGLIP